MLRREGNDRHPQRGAVAIIVALGLMVLLGFAALAVNMGAFRMAAAELQNASDSGALAGAWELTGDTDGMGQARIKAKEYAESHDAYFKPIKDVTAGDIELGIWDFDARNFKPGGDPADINAVRVTTYRNSVKGTSMSGVLGGIFDADGEELRRATAVGGGPASLCGFPVVVPHCVVLNPDGSPKCNAGPTQIKLSNDIVDNGGLTSLDEEQHANVNYVQGLIEDYKENCDWKTVVDKCIQVMNGNPRQPVGQTVRDVMLDPDGDGVEEPVDVWLPVIDTEPCPGIKFNQCHHVSGFVKFRLTHVELPSDPGDPKQFWIEGEVLCDEVPTGMAGGKFYGGKGRPRLVE